MNSSRALSRRYQAVAHPVSYRLSGFQGGSGDELVFGCGESHATDLGARVLDVRSAHSGFHAAQLYGPRKELDKTYFVGHNKYMTTTRTPSPLIAKCRNGHVVRGENRMGLIVATTPGATASGNCWLHCPCGSVGAVKYLTVKIVEEKTCNGICMGATGPSCSCSCGGENHGGNHVFS